MRISIVVLALIVNCNLFSQEHKETIKKELSFELQSPHNTFILANINGHITATGYDGDKILIEANKTIKAKTAARLEEGVKEISLGIIDLADTIIVYIKNPCSNPNIRKNKKGKRFWDYYFQKCDCDWETRYDFQFDFTLKIPYKTNVSLGTINDGDISVMNMSGELTVDNINGSIRLDKVAGMTKASTINGDLDVNYTKNPNKDSRYYSLNGDINANFQKGLDAKMLFKSYNGDFYTNIQELEIMPMPIKKEKVSDENGISYKIGGQSAMQIRKGSLLLDFETFNGDVYVKEN